MGERTEISWADATLNVWTGCTKVSPACDGCYAEHLMDHRMGRVAWGPHGERIQMKGWRSQIHKIERLAAARVAAGGEPYFVFCMSLGDVFDNQVDPAWRRELFSEIRKATHCVFLLLTKRPQNIRRLSLDVGGLPPNCATGMTVVSQPELERDAGFLARAAADLKPAFAFVSIEPMLGPMIVAPYFGWLGWVIAGGETDQGAHKARPSHPDWLRSLRDQCSAAGVPFHFKQWGEWREVQAGDEFDTSLGRAGKPPAFIVDPTDGTVHCFLPVNPDPRCRAVIRVGKKAAGRALDGVIHDARPSD